MIVINCNMLFNRKILYVVLIIGLVSCQSIRLEKRRYKKGYHFTTNIQKRNISPIEKSKQKLTSFDLKKDSILNSNSEQVNIINNDTVRVILKNGKIHQGVITEEKEKGIFLQVSPERTIYLSRYEIEEIVLVNPPKTTEKKESSIEEEYYSEDVEKEQKTFRERVRKTEETDQRSVPKQTETAEVLFYLTAGSLAYAGFLFPLLLILGLIFNRKGYKIALANPDKYNMDKVEKVRRMYKILLITYLAITLFLIGLVIIIFMI